MADENYGQAAVTGAGFGTGLYDFGYTSANLPVSGAATTVSQFDAGGVAFDWNSALHDITGAWLAYEGMQSQWPGAAVQYRRGEDGKLYTTGGQLVQEAPNAPPRITLTGLLVVGGIVYLLMKGGK